MRSLVTRVSVTAVLRIDWLQQNYKTRTIIARLLC